MSVDDYLDADRPILPLEAGTDTPKGFEPNDEWLKSADEDMQVEGMRQWFRTRYCDPAMETPYSEGEYIYIHGGPYEAADQLHDRFGDIFDEDTIQKAVAEVESEGVHDWAPIHTDEDYDQNFELGAADRDEPLEAFRAQLTEIVALAASPLEEPLKAKLRLLLFSSLITALEAYLADTMSYWVRSDRAVFRALVANCEEFKREKLALAEILVRMDSLDNEVDTYLKQLIWHRLDKITPLMGAALGITMPEYKELMRSVATRHDIVHRGGKTKDGDLVTASDDDLETLRVLVETYVGKIDAAIQARFPIFPPIVDANGQLATDESVPF